MIRSLSVTTPEERSDWSAWMTILGICSLLLAKRVTGGGGRSLRDVDCATARSAAGERREPLGWPIAVVACGRLGFQVKQIKRQSNIARPQRSNNGLQLQQNRLTFCIC